MWIRAVFRYQILITNNLCYQYKFRYIIAILIEVNGGRRIEFGPKLVANVLYLHQALVVFKVWVVVAAWSSKRKELQTGSNIRFRIQDRGGSRIPSICQPSRSDFNVPKYLVKLQKYSLLRIILLLIYVSLRLCVQNAVSAQPCVGKFRISLVLLNFLHCNFRLWFETP